MGCLAVASQKAFSLLPAGSVAGEVGRIELIAVARARSCAAVVFNCSYDTRAVDDEEATTCDDGGGSLSGWMSVGFGVGSRK